METLQVGKTYLFLGIPLWIKGRLEAENIGFFVVSADTAEYLPDATTLADYTLARVTGEKINRRTFVPRDGTYVIEV